MDAAASLLERAGEETLLAGWCDEFQPMIGPGELEKLHTCGLERIFDDLGVDHVSKPAYVDIRRLHQIRDENAYVVQSKRVIDHRSLRCVAGRCNVPLHWG